MAMSYKTRRRWALAVLLVGLPAYILVASVLATWIKPDSFIVMLLLYIGLGVAWIMPLKSLFLGIGQADPRNDTK